MVLVLTTVFSGPARIGGPGYIVRSGTRRIQLRFQHTSKMVLSPQWACYGDLARRLVSVGKGSLRDIEAVAHHS